MGKRGPAPKPTNLRVLHGDRKDRINTAEPQPGQGGIAAPVELSEGAQEVWDRLAPDRIRVGVLTSWDVDAFAEFCEALVLAREKRRLVASGAEPKPGCSSPVSEWRSSMAIVSQLGARFGWTPSDRAQLTVQEDRRDAKDDLLSS